MYYNERIYPPGGPTVTEKLYYIDSLRTEFTARVLSCEAAKDAFDVVLDRTAFFPEGGGQPGDAGMLGSVRVLDTRERDGVVLHRCTGPLGVGAEVSGAVDRELRFARMQIHSGEHIVSGTAHRDWGCENVGFHMTERAAVLDFDRELDAQQLSALERMANEAVWADLPIRILTPSPEELAGITFRQKKELTGQIRLVEIPGVDLCACCAPHMPGTGRIGLIQFTDAARHRGGMRITMKAGRAAYEAAAALSSEADSLSRLFSAPREGLAEAAGRLLERQEAQEAARVALERKYCALLVEKTPETAGNIALFESDGLSAAALRELAGALAEKCGGVAGVFAGADGAWRCVLASKSVDLRQWVRPFNAALRGRGGGSPEMVQGSAGASRREIEEYMDGQNG